VDDDPAMANEGCELEYRKYASWKDTPKMQEDADFVPIEVEVVVALAWSRADRTRRGTVWTEISAEVEVREAGERKPEKRACEDDP